MGKTLIDLIRKGDDLQYIFNLNTKLVSESDVLDDSDIKLRASGRLKSAIEAAKSVAEKD